MQGLLAMRADRVLQKCVALYGRCMQIELSIRDLKWHRYGQGFEDSLTRNGKRIEILLLVNVLALLSHRIRPPRSESRYSDLPWAG
jgi:hypothetical protein